MQVARKETLVQLTDELVEKLDSLARGREVSRSELIRAVLLEFVRREDHEEKVRRDIEGYTKFPQEGETDEWGKLDDWAEWALREAIREEPWD